MRFGDLMYFHLFVRALLRGFVVSAWHPQATVLTPLVLLGLVRRVQDSEAHEPVYHCPNTDRLGAFYEYLCTCSQKAQAFTADNRSNLESWQIAPLSSLPASWQAVSDQGSLVHSTGGDMRSLLGSSSS